MIRMHMGKIGEPNKQLCTNPNSHTGHMWRHLAASFISHNSSGRYVQRGSIRGWRWVARDVISLIEFVFKPPAHTNQGHGAIMTVRTPRPWLPTPQASGIYPLAGMCHVGAQKDVRWVACDVILLFEALHGPWRASKPLIRARLACLGVWALA